MSNAQAAADELAKEVEEVSMQEPGVQSQALESGRQSPGLSTGRASPTDQAATQNAPADSGANIEQTEEPQAHNDAEDEAQEMGDYQYLMLETTKASEPQTLAVFMRATHLFAILQFYQKYHDLVAMEQFETFFSDLALKFVELGVEIKASDIKDPSDLIKLFTRQNTTRNPARLVDTGTYEILASLLVMQM